MTKIIGIIVSWVVAILIALVFWFAIAANIANLIPPSAWKGFFNFLVYGAVMVFFGGPIAVSVGIMGTGVFVALDNPEKFR